MMVQVFSRIRAALLVAGCAAMLAGCAGSVAPEVKRLPERVELSGTFYRGEANQSGPQVLASLLSQQGIVITPGLLEKPLHCSRISRTLLVSTAWWFIRWTATCQRC
jgi:hypothetical protein